MVRVQLVHYPMCTCSSCVLDVGGTASAPTDVYKFTLLLDGGDTASTLSDVYVFILRFRCWVVYNLGCAYEWCLSLYFKPNS